MNRILVGLDASPRAPGVLAAAVAIARAQGARVVLLRSIGLPPDIPQDFWKTTEEPLLLTLQHHARHDLEDLARTVPPEVLGGVEVEIGVPWQAVCDAARSQGADLVVIGSHGYSGFDRLLGTTAAKIVNHAHCSVLVVREARREAPHP